MTADWARVPYEVLRTISSRIINEVTGCNRVVLISVPSLPAPSSGSRDDLFSVTVK